MLGEPVARRFAADGYHVKIMGRSLDRLNRQFPDDSFEKIEGDAEDTTALRKAMDGCSTVHMSVSGHVSGDFDLEKRCAQAIVQVAKDLGTIQRISFISGATTCDDNSWFPLCQSKLETEKILQDSEISYIIFRCTMFFELLPFMIEHSGRPTVLGNQPTKWHWTAADDFSRMVSASFRTAPADNKILHVRGPEALTYKEAFDIYLKASGSDESASILPFWVARIISWLPGMSDLRNILPLMKYFAKTHEHGDPSEANELLGKPTTTLQDWTKEHCKESAK